MSLLRNVTLQDFEGIILAGFWQYGDISWSAFGIWLKVIISTPDESQWAIFDIDGTSPDCRGAQRTFDAEIVAPGDYILLRQDRSPLSVTLTRARARPRQPTHSSTPTQTDHYRNRTHERDRRCLITKFEFFTWSQAHVAHIFPRSHVDEWLQRGYHNLITDDARPTAVGGYPKIDSLQNCLLLKANVHLAWDNYEFGVDPNDNYRITAFVRGLHDMHGLQLHLDHIEEPKHCPLDELLHDHFRQGILKHMKGVGEPTWDYEDAFGDGAFDLSKQDVWGNDEGKERLELEIMDRLFEHQVAQENELGGSRSSTDS